MLLTFNCTIYLLKLVLFNGFLALKQNKVLGRSLYIHYTTDNSANNS